MPACEVDVLREATAFCLLFGDVTLLARVRFEPVRTDSAVAHASVPGFDSLTRRLCTSTEPGLSPRPAPSRCMRPTVPHHEHCCQPEDQGCHPHAVPRGISPYACTPATCRQRRASGHRATKRHFGALHSAQRNPGHNQGQCGSPSPDCAAAVSLVPASQKGHLSVLVLCRRYDTTGWASDPPGTYERLG